MEGTAKCQGTPAKDHAFFEETLGSPFAGVRSYVIVTTKSHYVPSKEMILAPQQKMEVNICAEKEASGVAG